MTLDDVIQALEMTNDASEAFYDLVTHEITWLDDFGMTREEYESVRPSDLPAYRVYEEVAADGQ